VANASALRQRITVGNASPWATHHRGQRITVGNASPWATHHRGQRITVGNASPWVTPDVDVILVTHKCHAL
jgi:hypothetical protein